MSQDNIPQGQPTLTSETVSFTVPLTISVSLGMPEVGTSTPQNVPKSDTSSSDTSQPMLSPRDAEENRDAEDNLEVIRIDPDYSNRRGYAPDFLGQVVPLPTLSAAQRQQAARNRDARPGTDPLVLPYHQYSLVMNKARKTAFYTAGNIDGSRSLPIPRKEFPSDRDTWHPDPRIPLDAQSSDANYASRGTDRGHLQRREYHAWGADLQEAKFANDDTFHFTNCAAQHEKFNRGASLWLGLENYVLKTAKARRQRVSVFVGPVLDRDDPVIDDIQVPLTFWKILVFRRTDGTLSASAYTLNQSGLIAELLEAQFAPSEHQVPIADIITLTNLDFSHLVAYDSLSRSPEEATGLHESLENPRPQLLRAFTNIAL